MVLALRGDFLEQQLNFLIGDLKKSKSFRDKSSILDVRSIKDLRSKLQGNVAVNLAAIHRDNIPDPDEYYSTNVEGAHALCQVCEEKGINKIVFTSSVAVYGFAPSGTGEDGAIEPFSMDAPKHLLRKSIASGGIEILKIVAL